MKQLTILLISVVSLCLSSCGGGGGGSNFVGAGNVSIDITPNQIDTGDRALVTVHFDNTHKDGVTIKLRYPDGLEYVKDTSFLQIDGKDFDIGPSFEVAADIAQSTFLVYNLGPDILLKDNGRITFELEGKSPTGTGRTIEVDIDVLKPQFSSEAAEFEPEDEEPVEVL